MSTLSKQVMRRVYFIWGVRQLVRPLFLKLAVLALLVWQVKEAVFVRQVFVNMADYKAEELFNFWSAAFLNTDLIVQTAILGIGILAILLVREVVSKDERGLVFARQ
ncbi:MAG: hypothetical protein HYY92_01960 [Parcubacteria group bacterium]|nr:hypothetical protein [Parcubacteria group bacterium]